MKFERDLRKWLTCMSARISAADKARRLIALLGRLREGTRTPLADLAAELGTTPAALASDLETLSVCGIAPYSPMELVPVLVDGGIVEVWGSVPAMRGPVRLSPAEASALAAALTAAGFSADDPLLERLLLAASSAFDAEELARTLHTRSSAHSAATFEEIAAGIARREVLAIAYQREGAESPTLRRVEPLQLFADRGVWYMSAWCRRAGAYRTFRVDRVRGVERTAEAFDPAARIDWLSPTALAVTLRRRRGVQRARMAGRAHCPGTPGRCAAGRCALRRHRLDRSANPRSTRSRRGTCAWWSAQSGCRPRAR